jgi:hypothetical protein
MFARWDTFYYYTIATSGYRWVPRLFAPQDVVFFPLYPTLMRAVGWLCGGHPLAAGALISFAAFSAALTILYRLAVLEIGADAAPRAVLLLATFPYALFFSAVYTESLFLLLTAGAFYAMRRGRLEWVAIAGLLAGLTRPNGFWLAVPLGCLALWPGAAAKDGDPARRPGLPLTLAVSCAPILGTLLFSLYLQRDIGDALAWIQGQAAWGLPLVGRGGAPDALPFHSTETATVSEIVVYLGNIAACLAALMAIRPATRRLGLAYGLWIVVNIVPPLAGHLFISLGRFVSVLFPFFFWLALRIPRERVRPVAAVFFAGQVIMAFGFFLWLKVY